MASGSGSSSSASNWRESDKKYFPNIYQTEPKKFIRHRYPNEDYTLQARTRSQRAIGQDQEFLVRPDGSLCGTCELCFIHAECGEKCQFLTDEEALLQTEPCKRCTQEAYDLNGTEFRWLPNRVHDRLTVLSIQDATAYDKHMLKRASNNDPIPGEVENIRIWPNLHQYRHNYTFTNSATPPNITYQGTGNSDGFGVFCCKDCYLEARQQEKDLFWAGPTGQNWNGDEEYTSLHAYNTETKKAIALRKEANARQTEYDMAQGVYRRYVQDGNSSSAAAVAAPPSLPPAPVSSVVAAPALAPAAAAPPTTTTTTTTITNTPTLKPGYKWEKGWACNACTHDTFFDRKVIQSQANAGRTLQRHIERFHPGGNVELLGRPVTSTIRQRKIAATVAPSSRKPKPKKAVSTPAPALAVVPVVVDAAGESEETDHAAPLPEEILGMISFDRSEDDFLNLSDLPSPRGLGAVVGGLVHHGGVPAVRAAFSSLRRGAVLTEVEEGWWEDEEGGRAVRWPPL